MDAGRSELQGDELPPGSKLCGGQYTIDRYLSAGGFGVTYLARDSLGRQVVIKECFPSALCFRTDHTVRVRSQGNALDFDTILELFEKEARALASLQHPYIVGVHQYFRDNETAYMAMDFVEGCTLLDIIENDPGRLTPEVVRSLLTQILQAVSFIHRHDILHRDISPDNILIDDDNFPVLIDFGAAREDATRVSRVLSKMMTVKDGYSPQEFYVAGSEQVAASDLYALAATFHHVVSGTIPTSSQSRMAAAVRDADDPITPLGRTEGYDDTFIAAINTCLSLFPQDRLPTADAWQELIDAELRHEKLQRRAEMDHTLDQEISRLVQHFFNDFHPRRHELDMSTGAGATSALPNDTGSVRPGPVTAKQGATGADGAVHMTDNADPYAIHPDLERFYTTEDFKGPPTAAELIAANAKDPAMQPIERIRRKYMKPPEPENDEEPVPSPEPVSWLVRLGLKTRGGDARAK